jgi:hypothetical protein
LRGRDGRPDGRVGPVDQGSSRGRGRGTVGPVGQGSSLEGEGRDGRPNGIVDQLVRVVILREGEGTVARRTLYISTGCSPVLKESEGRPAGRTV